MAVKNYKINFKSDFVLTVQCDAGWNLPFCVKFWTGAPSQSYFAGFDGTEYRNCRMGDTPDKLVVLFDDHHLPVGELKMQIAYHTTIEEFPTVEYDEVTNAQKVTTILDGEEYHVILDFTGETAPEIQFALPAYYNEQERQRVFAEMQAENAQAVQEAENVNAQLDGTILTVTNRNGASTTTNVKGEKGDKGDTGTAASISVGTVTKGNTASVTNSGTTSAAVFNFVLPKGEDGVGIVSITYKDTDAQGGNVYTVLLDNGHSYDITCPKGDASTADINLNGSIISVTNNEGVTKTIDVLSSTDERVQITVTTDVPGVSVAGLTINAYYNNASVPTATCTTDANGMAVLSVPNGYKYRLVFPTIQGCKPIADVVHTASVSQRSVEVEYLEDVVTEGEVVKVVLTQKTGETISKVSGATVNVTVDGVTTSYTTDSQGIAMLTVPYGKTYTVTAPQREGWYLHENSYARTYTADQTGRVILYAYRQYDSGLFIVASDGSEYTLEQWEEAVEAGTRQNSEAKLIKVSTGALVQAGGVFAVDIDHLRSRSYGANKAWSSQNVQFNSVPLNGNSTSANYYYDGLTASRLVQTEGDERAIDTLAADKCLAESRVLAEGTENELTLPGFLGSIGQWKELWMNAAEVDDILTSVRPDGTYLLSTLTTAKWTITQSNALNSWCWGTAAAVSGKVYSCVVLPFFAY